jgi:hypothetical protein
MIISTDTPALLTVTHRPVALIAALVAAAGLLTFLAGYNLYQGNTGKALLTLLLTLGVLGPCLWFGMERVQVSFDAAAGTCAIEVRRLTGTTSQTLPLADIDRAMLQTHKGQSDTRDAHRVALVLGENRAENRRPLTTGYSTGPAAARAVDRINDWLTAHRGAAGA